MGWRVFNLDEFREKVRKQYEQDVATDPRQKERLARHECKACYYTVRFTGQAFTRYTCKMCGKEDMHHNTGVPMLCANCADKNVLCAQCGKTRD
jgi:hypothetical protein